MDCTKSKPHRRELPSHDVINGDDAPVHHLGAPHTLNFGISGSREPIDADLLVPPAVEQFRVPPHLRDSVYFGTELLFGPPRPNQLIRKLSVDKLAPKFYICDPELREIFWQFHGGTRKGSASSRVLSIDELASGLQRVFLSHIAGGSERLSEKLMAAQAEVNADLLEIIKSFSGKEEALLQDGSVEGVGPLARAFWTTVLAFLQRRKVFISGDCLGLPTPNGNLLESCNHVIDIHDHGVLFDLRQSLGESSALFIYWRELKVLPEMGIWFLDEELVGIPLPRWFGSPSFNPRPAPTNHRASFQVDSPDPDVGELQTLFSGSQISTVINPHLSQNKAALETKAGSLERIKVECEPGSPSTEFEGEDEVCSKIGDFSIVRNWGPEGAKLH